MRRAAILCVFCLLVGCSSHSHRIDMRAREAGLSRYVVQGNRYQTLYYLRSPATSERLVIFLEGDGRPWIRGVEPSTDPTTRNPTALELLLKTPGAVAYVTRPCYHALDDPNCSFQQWTGGRYALEIVETMSNAVARAAQRANAKHVVLVGVSGGGALAVLIAERNAAVSAVVTVAGNLDVAAWTDHHRYLRLEGSLNPAASSHAHAFAEIHLQGARDEIIPPSLTDRYFARFPRARRWLIHEHGHTCCWKNAWPELWRRIESELATSSASPPTALPIE